MESQVEKLYEKARVELVADVKFPAKDVNYNIGYPPFTAEKQINLIKNFDYFEMRFENWEYLLFASNDEEHRYHSHHKIFEAALAALINTIWQDLTIEDKQRIKEILE